MKLKFLAGAGPISYDISEQVISGIDTSLFVKGSRFTGSEETKEAGIFHMFWQNDELHVVLAQPCGRYECAPTNGSHDWVESDWIDSAAYDPHQCYIVAASAPADSKYELRDTGWTVLVPAPSQEELS